MINIGDVVYIVGRERELFVVINTKHVEWGGHSVTLCDLNSVEAIGDIYRQEGNLFKNAFVISAQDIYNRSIVIKKREDLAPFEIKTERIEVSSIRRKQKKSVVVWE